jgi:hypothetical protein
MPHIGDPTSVKPTIYDNKAWMYTICRSSSLPPQLLALDLSTWSWHSYSFTIARNYHELNHALDLNIGHNGRVCLHGNCDDKQFHNDHAHLFVFQLADIINENVSFGAGAQI